MTQVRDEEVMGRIKKTYDRVSEEFSASRKRPWKEFLVLADCVSEGDKVLDVGCGDGRFYEAIRDRHVDYTGLDFSGGLLDVARKRYPKLSFLERNVVDFRADERFDVIVSVAALHHLPSPATRLKALENLHSALRDDGTFAFTVWDLWQWRYVPRFLRATLRMVVSRGGESWKDLWLPFGKSKAERYYHAFTGPELRRLLRATGFRMVRLERRYEGRHNYVVICKKTLLKTVQQPIPVMQGALERKFSSQPQAVSSRFK